MNTSLNKSKSILIAVILTGIMACLSLVATAQQVSYKVTRDNPSDICNFWLFLDPLQMDAPFNNFDGFSFNTGLWSTGFVGNRLGFDVVARYGTVTFGKIAFDGARSALQFEAGGMLVYRDNTRIKNNTKVVIDTKESVTSSGTRVTTTKYITIPANRRNISYLRGGFYLKRNPYSYEFPDYSDIEGDLTCAGIYIGLGSMKISNVFINTDTDGKASRSGAFRLYADLLFCPIRKITPVASSIPVPADYKTIAGPIGFRLGMIGMPVEDRSWHKRKAFAAGVEVGYRPGDGLFATASWYIPLMRRKSAALGYRKPEGTNDKGQTIEKE